MHERPYEAEAILQALIAEHPEVLAGGGTDAGSEWLLVKREAGISSAEDGGHGWLDHLFLDADGVPTLVEVKRSSHTRARREVVAQLLDYAATAPASWTVERLQAWFEDEHAPDSAATLADCGVSDADAFWRRVRTNLAADRIRLVFVADKTRRGCGASSSSSTGN